MRRRPLGPLGATSAVALAALSGCFGDTSAPDGAGASTAAVVDRVVDGDTLVALVDGERARVRLIGVDAPESVRPDHPVECFGPQAAERAADLLPEGAPVRLEADPTQDRRDDFGRLLAYVFVPGEDRPVNQVLVAEGYARVRVYGGRPFRDLGLFRADEARARASGRGLWGACGPP